MASAANLNQSSATPIDALRQQIEAVLTAQGGTWVFVENVVAGSWNHYIWRNKGSGVANPNSFGTDFYIGLCYATSNPNLLSIICFETYDEAANTLTRPVSAGGQATNADTSTGSTSGIALTGQPAAPLCAGQAQAPVAPGTFDSLICVSKNALKVVTKLSTVASRYTCYAGLFEPLHPAANEFPICIATNMNAGFHIVAGESSSPSNVRTSRHPTRISAASVQYNHTLTIQPFTPVGGDTSKIDALYGKAQASRAVIRQTGGVTSQAQQTYGDLRGLLHDVVIIPNPIAMEWGEKLTIDSKEYWGFHFGSQAQTNPMPAAAPAAWVDTTAV